MKPAPAFVQFVGRLGRLPRRTLTEARLIWLRLANRWSNRSVLGRVDAVVSLTTYGERFRKVHLAIESIARGTERPKRLILWLDEADLLANPTPQVARLQRRGLELRITTNYGPHKKYFPALGLVQRSGISRLVTADDDTLYPSGWLRDLDRVAACHPGDVVCHRARVLQLASDGILPWDRWPECSSSAPSLTHFGIGDAGISYPRELVDALSRRGAAFADHAPNADDVWLHATAVSGGVATRQVSARPARPVGVPGTQRTALRTQNVAGGRNDAQIRATYTDADIEALRKVHGNG